MPELLARLTHRKIPLKRELLAPPSEGKRCLKDVFVKQLRPNENLRLIRPTTR